MTLNALKSVIEFNWIHPRTTATMPNMYKRKLREDLDINRIKTLKETDKS